MGPLTAFYMDDDSPLIQYEIAFQKRPKLLMSGAGAYGGSSGTSEVYAGVTESLEDEIKWKPRVDEADKLDYIVAVSSGVLAGLIDVFYAGEFSLDRASEWGKDKIEKVVMKVARVEGYTGDDLNDAIKALEKNHPLAADGACHERELCTGRVCQTRGLLRGGAYRSIWRPRIRRGDPCRAGAADCRA